jgi:heat shock protein HslJ
VLPCADCPGIETAITLDSGNAYTIKSKYLGKGSNSFEDHGNFTWNEAGNTITLIGAKQMARKFFVGENSLTQLDSAGNKIAGALASKYVLTKSMASSSGYSSNAELVETYWKLTELMGKKVKPTPQGKKEVHIILKKQDNRIQGFAGCNTISGVYELKPGNRISFSKVITTMMACPDMSTEDQLKKVIERADNYSIKGNHLSLNKARMAPLARFEAVYLR